ncbi:MAG: hypothetical protein LIO96_09785 [Lachnospiraceae bacterium]|nr:hypothetical protein [Lachnospiraceae bacterium]
MESQVDDLSKSFGSKEVLRDIHFTFESGRIYGLLGCNGAGKITFLNELFVKRHKKIHIFSYVWGVLYSTLCGVLCCGQYPDLQIGAEDIPAAELRIVVVP